MKVERKFQNNAYDLVMQKLHSEGFTAYGVGGCVRDTILGYTPNDIDVATNARPHDLTKVFGAKSWDGDGGRREGADGVVLYPTGVRHGTWTIRLLHDEVEVTSFRRDVETDGRNATVEFADTYEEDATRRDFTMNALYIDQDDNVLDPTGTGIADLLAGHVRFVGNAEDRVKEDYLRILRLFRFHARFGRGPLNAEAAQAASKWASMIQEKVSGERIWSEIRKLLSLNTPFESCEEMRVTLVAEKLFGSFDLGTLSTLMANEHTQDCTPSWSRRYAALVGGEIPLPCSNAERAEVAALCKALDAPRDTSQAVTAYRYGYVTAFDWALIRGLSPDHAELMRGAEAVFPVSSQDLMDQGYTPGKALGDELRALKDTWETSNFKALRETLLDTCLRKP